MTANPADTDQQPTITWGLIMDILDVLERHGVRKSGSDRDVGRAVGLVGSLALAYGGADNDARALGERAWALGGR